MNEYAKKWVEALKSGEYKQIRDFLHTKEGYCCLGVACEIFKDVCNLNKEENSYGIWSYNGNDCFLPKEVVNLLELNNEEGRFRESLKMKRSNNHRYYTVYSLSEMNDDGFSFNEIAKFIEENEDQLFVTQEERS